jgi:hypothetical protein
MAIVTLLTDSGTHDHYVAAIKARILSVNPGVKIFDVSHSVASCDIAHGAFVLRSVFRDFPKRTTHLIGVNATGNRGDGYLAVQLEDHYFVGCDNGIFGLISARPFQGIVELNTVNAVASSFPERDILAPAAARLASGIALADLGVARTEIRRLTDRSARTTRRQISGHVIRVDHFGNLITNIEKEAFDTLSAGKGYTLQLGTEKLRKINSAYNQVEPGDCFALFNSLGWLEIGVNKGNASELLGLQYDSPVIITFDEP